MTVVGHDELGIERKRMNYTWMAGSLLTTVTTNFCCLHSIKVAVDYFIVVVVAAPGPPDNKHPNIIQSYELTWSLAYLLTYLVSCWLIWLLASLRFFLVIFHSPALQRNHETSKI